MENQNGIYSFKRTLFSMLNNCISGVIETALLNVITVKKKKRYPSSHSEPACNFVTKSKCRYRRRFNLSLLSSRSTIKAILLSASVSDSLLQTSVALSANLCSVIKVAALLLADGYPATPAGHQSIKPWPALAAVTTVSCVKGEC